MKNILKTLTRQDVILFILCLSLFGILLFTKFTIESYNSMCSPYIPSKASFCKLSYKPWAFTMVPFLLYYLANLLVLSKIGDSIKQRYDWVYMEKWYFRTLHLIFASHILGIVTKGAAFPFYEKHPYIVQESILFGMTGLFLVCAVFTTKWINRGTLVYLDLKNTETKRQQIIRTAVRLNFPQCLNAVVSDHFSAFAQKSPQGVIILWALKVGEISFENDEAFVSVVIGDGMRGALEKLSQFNWFLRVESSLDIPGLRNVTWRSAKGKNGLVLELDPDTIDFTKTFPYPGLYSPVVPERSPLDVILGKDEKWIDVSFNLAVAPHLLVAGATGKGKSVGMNNIIVSLLKNILDGHPIEHIFLIDPKKVEFGPYRELPYTTYCEDLYEAVQILESMAVEMDKRYKILLKENVRSLDEFRKNGGNMRIQVAIVDEFADIICHFDKDLVLRFEKAVQRITQLWRAAGIHIILATQRPSADVIKPIIRSNITARLGFGTAGQADSDIILQDKSGSLVKLPRGECYLSIPSGIIHLKTYFLSDDEVKSFIAFYAVQADLLAATPLSIIEWDPKIGDYLAAFRAHLKEIWAQSPELKSPVYLLFARLLAGGGYKSRADLRLFATEVGIKHKTIDTILQIFRERGLVLFDDTMKTNYLSPSIIKDQPNSLVPLYTAIQEGLWN